MLVLSRKRNQGIEINGGCEKGGITIVVVEIRDGKVRLGLQAPISDTINRTEVQNAIDRKNEEAEAEKEANDLHAKTLAGLKNGGLKPGEQMAADFQPR